MKKTYVLVTGASTGIGFDICRHLRSLGMDVFACYRSPKDREALAQLGCRPLRSDVTDSESIQKSLLEVQKVLAEAHAEAEGKSESLIKAEAQSKSEVEVGDQNKNDTSTSADTSNYQFILVNNAGIAVPGPVELLKLEKYREQFEVNFFGVIQVTQAFLPILRKSAGHIINISSISGRGSAPFLSAYSASKFALEALSDSLRWELEPFGVRVTILEPGAVKTPIWNKNLLAKEKMISEFRQEHLEIYRRRLGRFIDYAETLPEQGLEVSVISENVARAIQESGYPKRIVLGNFREKIQTELFGLLPTSWIDYLLKKMI